MERLNVIQDKQKKKGHPSGWPFLLFDVWQFPTLAWGDPTLPSALRRFTSEFGMGSGGTTALLPPDKFFYLIRRTLLKTSGADTQSRTGDLTLTKGALYQLSHISTHNLMPGSSLLSHGETPHYHRRYGVSLLSSAWGQVGPPRCRRQANSFHPRRHTIRATTGTNPRTSQISSSLSPKHLRCCKVKPLGSLVLVSSTYRYAYTPSLSTSSS